MPLVKSVVSIIDEDNPADPPFVMVIDINGTSYPGLPPVDVIDNIVATGYTIKGVSNFQIGNGIYTNVLLENVI